MPKRALIIDTDPGQDDAVAFMLALGNPDELDVLGITTIAGNVGLSKVTKNALKLLELAGRPDVPVFAGASAPFMVKLETAEYVHGETGLNGWEFPEPQIKAQPQFAPDWIVDTIMSRPEKSVTLCPLGPLTNIALALAREPRIATRLDKIVLMGGAQVEGGNVTPAAEFNIYVDPHAAARVFASGAEIVVMSLDVTHQALIKKSWLAELAGLGTKGGEAFTGLLSFYERYDEDKYGTDGGPLHDPTTIAYLLKPELFTGKFVNVEIETTPGLCFGQTVVDRWAVTGRAKNATWITGIDADGFFQLILDAFKKLP